MKTVCIYHAGTYFEALSIKEKLESKGIICLMPNEFITGVVPHYSIATGGFRLFVSESSYEDAIEILKTSFDIDGNRQRSEEPHPYSVTCPKCQSEDTSLVKHPRRGLILLTLILIGIPFPAYRYRYVCSTCGFQWIRRSTADGNK